jgi:hypothetical protein
MPKFRKNPVIVEAEQWYPGKSTKDVTERAGGVYGVVETDQGRLIVGRGDWIVTGPLGEKHIWRDYDFEQAFEPIEDETKNPPSA